MRRICLIAVAAAMMLTAVVQADPNFVLVHNFQDVPSGDKIDNRTPNGDLGGIWDTSTNSTSTIKAANRGNVPSDAVPSSRVLEFTNPSSGLENGCAVGQLTNPVDLQETGTLFFRFHGRDESASSYPTRAYMGFHALSVPEGDDFLTISNPSVIAAGFGILSNSQGTYDIVTTNNDAVLKTGLIYGRWYNAWIVAYNADKTFDLYISEAEGPAILPAGSVPPLPTNADFVAYGLRFSTPVDAPLTGAAFIIPGGAKYARSYIDEIWWNGDSGLFLPRYAVNPSPASGATEVSLNPVLSWDTGKDIINPELPDPNIAKYYLYLQADSSNFAGINPVEINATDPVSARVQYGPVSLNTDKTYYWRVDQGVDLPGGGVSGKDDPNTIRGRTWSFETIKTFPIFLTQPANVMAQPGGQAVFTVSVETVSPVNYQWYHVIGAAPDPGTDTPVGTNSPTLTLNNVQLADEGSYYAKATNSGGATLSTTAVLAISRLLARYEFEQNLQDSVGVNHGIAVGGMAYAAGVSGNFAIDPNGTNYAELPLTAYPKAGFGNGLETFTYSVWVKRGAYPEGKTVGYLMGNYNDGAQSGVHTSIANTGGATCSLRQDGGTTWSVSAPVGTLPETEWKHLVFTYNGETVKIYVDGLGVASSSQVSLTNYAAWQYPMALMARNYRGVIQDPYIGQADDLRIFNYAMSDDGAAQLYYDVSGIRPCMSRPSFDVSGPGGTQDCVVNLYDFAEFAADWLSSGLFNPAN